MIEGFMEYVVIIFFSIVGFCLGNFLIWRHDQKKKKNRRTDVMANLNELDKLEYYLKGAKIPFNRIDEDNRHIWDRGYTIGHDAMDKLGVPEGWGERHQIVAYKENGVDVDWDVICHWGSYGYEEGLLELMGSLLEDDEVEGYLSADDIIERIEKNASRG